MRYVRALVTFEIPTTSTAEFPVPDDKDGYARGYTQGLLTSGGLSNHLRRVHGARILDAKVLKVSTSRNDAI